MAESSRRENAEIIAHVPQEGDLLLDPMLRVLGVVAQMLPLSSEIVVHDFRKLPKSIVWIHGTVTEREYGDPPTNLLLAHVARGAVNDLLNYNTTMPDGRVLTCSTLILRNSEGTPIGAVCFNNETSDLDHLRARARKLLRTTTAPHTDRSDGQGPNPPIQTTHTSTTPTTASENLETAEVFPQSVEDLSEALLNDAVSAVGVPVGRMKKRHKLQVIRNLNDRGFFLLRDGVELSAQRLNVTRFTIYNYMKEICGKRIESDGSHASPDSEEG